MREGRKKARSNKQQGKATQHTFPKKNELAASGGTQTHDTLHSRQSMHSTTELLCIYYVHITQAMDGFLMVLAYDATILYVSDNLESYMGLSPRDVIGHTVHDLVQSQEDSETIRENLLPKG